MKRMIALVTVLAAGGVALQQRLRAQSAEQALWDEVIDTTPSARTLTQPIESR